jgi:hypothetical protein
MSSQMVRLRRKGSCICFCLFDLVEKFGLLIWQDPNNLTKLPSSVRRGWFSCTGIDALDVIDSLEKDLGKPVVTSNQASYWQCFEMAKVGEPIEGHGRLFREPR